MPYIKGTKERSREQAIQAPQNAGELNLSITTQCLEYLKEHGESYKHYTHVIHALSYNGTEGSYDHAKTPDGKHLKEKVNFIISRYRDMFRGGGDREEEISGTTKAAVMEFYWRGARLYENNKILANGDVFPQPEPLLSLMREILRLRDEMKDFKAQFENVTNIVTSLQKDILTYSNNPKKKWGKK